MSPAPSSAVTLATPWPQPLPSLQAVRAAVLHSHVVKSVWVCAAAATAASESVPLIAAMSSSVVATTPFDTMVASTCA